MYVLKNEVLLNIVIHITRQFETILSPAGQSGILMVYYILQLCHFQYKNLNVTILVVLYIFIIIFYHKYNYEIQYNCW